MHRPQRPQRTGSPYIDGIVLGAGRSARMGLPKALLTVDGETFLERGIRVLRDGGCRGIVVVLGADGREAVRRAETSGASVVRNPDGDAEQAGSLRLGLAAVGEDAAGAAVLPVDHPLVRASTVLALLAAFRRTGAPVVRPVYCGVAGHPTLFARSLFGELSAPSLPEGARSVIAARATEVVDVPVKDPGVVADIDTPEDYRRLVEGTC